VGFLEVEVNPKYIQGSSFEKASVIITFTNKDNVVAGLICWNQNKVFM
jgi:hypothetical protein